MRHPAALLLPTMILASSLAGCSTDFFTEAKFKTPEFFARQDYATAPKVDETAFRSSVPVAPEDFIDANGSCAGVTAAAPPAEAALAAPAGENPGPVLAAGGVGLGMTECEVVRRAGQPGKVEISADANSERATVLTYLSGTWPGIYRFSAGRLKEVERVEAPPPPPKVAKKKATKPKSAAR